MCQHFATLFIVALQVLPIQRQKSFLHSKYFSHLLAATLLGAHRLILTNQLLVSAATLGIAKSSDLFLSNSGVQDPRKLCVREVYTQLVAKVGL